LKVAILGGGFGLYGYLPAAVSLGWEVTTLTKYSSKIYERIELSQFSNQIEFVDSEAELIESSAGIILARSPRMQFEFLLENCSSIGGKSHVFLEKPLTDSLTNSGVVLDLLRNNQVSFSVGYLFTYTDWFQELVSLSKSSGNRILINWKIPSTNSSWKNNSELGGGLCSFYLVHLVPVLTELNFLIKDSIINLQEGKFSLKSKNANAIEVNAEITDEEYCFEVWVNNDSNPLYRDKTPFGPRPISGIPDPRIGTITNYLSKAAKLSGETSPFYQTELDVQDFLRTCIAKV
jgi:hypothetical protein